MRRPSGPGAIEGSYVDACASVSWCRTGDAAEVGELAASPSRPAGTGCSSGRPCGASTPGSRSRWPRAHHRRIRLGTHADAAAAPQAVGAGRPGGDRRPAVGRPGHACRSGSARSTAGSPSSARSSTAHARRADGRGPGDHAPGCGRASRSATTARTTSSRRATSPPSGTSCSSPDPPVWCVGALGSQRSMARALRWDGLLPQVVDRRRRPPVHAGGADRRDAGDPGSHRRPAVRRRRRGQLAGALARGVVRGRRDVVDREPVGRDARADPVGSVDRPAAGDGRRRDAGPASGMATARVSTAVGWNFAEIWERNADRFPDAVAQVQGDRDVSRGASSTAAPTASPPRCSPPAPRSRTRWRTTCTTAPSTSRACSGMFKAGARAGEHQLPLHRRRARRTCGTTPTPSRSSSTARSPSAARRCASGCPRCSTWIWVDDGTATVPRLGDRRTRPRRAVGDAAHGRRRGDAAPTTCTSSTPAARRACRRA